MESKVKGNLLVLGQFGLLAILVFYPSRPISFGSLSFLVSAVTAVLLVAGFGILGLSFLALGKSLTAHPIPASRGELVTDGLYRYARHPIYTGVLALGAAMTLLGGLILLLNYKASFEEELLRARYPEYASYAAKTGRFLPKLKR